jgi:hypothetical protein
MKGGELAVAGMASSLLVLCLCADARGQSVTIVLEGEVPTSCRMETPSTKLLLGELHSAGSATIAFRVRCNTPFLFAMVSQAGGLVVDDAGPTRAGFTSRLPYTASVQIPTTAGSMSGSCTSSALQATKDGCVLSSSQGGIALTGEALLTISWPQEERVISGTYADQITLSVRPRI